MTALAERIVDTARSGSGIVHATRGKLRRLFCLQDGWIVYATSNVVEEQLGEFLVRSGALGPEERTHAARAASASGKKLGQVLLEGRSLPAEALERAQAALVRELLFTSLEWTGGTAAAESGVPRLAGEILVRLSPYELLIEHAVRYPEKIDALRVRIGPPNLRPVAGTDPGIPLDPLGAYLLRTCDGTVDLATVVLGAPAEETTTLRRIYGFLLAGLLEREDRATREARSKRSREADLSREECLGRLTLSSSHDHYAVLGLDRSARREQIRDAYYALARRYHPDRFRSGPLIDLLPRFEEFFAKVTSAYNTLYDADMRTEYDRQAEAPASEADRTGDTGYIARQNFLRGKAAAAHRRYSEAVTFLENAIQQDPAQAEYQLELGLVLSRNPRLRAEAERYLLQAVNLAPTLVAGYIALGQIYLRAGRAGRAAKMAREALRWEPDHLEASSLLAEAGNASDEGEARGA